MFVLDQKTPTTTAQMKLNETHAAATFKPYTQFTLDVRFMAIPCLNREDANKTRGGRKGLSG
jgi:hypothetical protein